MPLLMLILVGSIIAPINEELVFRGALRRIFRNEKVFIIISAIVFGLIHTIFAEESLLNALVLAIPYATMGAGFAYVYAKTNNICTSIIAHMALNTIVTLGDILVMLIR